MNATIRFPAEWESHRAVWLAWPSAADLWGRSLPDVQREFTGLCRAIADIDPETGIPRGEDLWVLVPDEEREAEARTALGGLGATFFRAPFGDIWLRDTAPLFLSGGSGRVANCFQFNGWGGKYILDYDDQVSETIAGFTEVEDVVLRDWVLEGGSIEGNGVGDLLTTKECLLHPNRNPKMNREAIVTRLRVELGAVRVHWLQQGLIGDHTDGHIDNIARFVGPSKIVCMESLGATDPNRDILEAVQRELSALRNSEGFPFEVLTVPSAGRVVDEQGNLMAASHVNFYIGNQTVVVPLYPGSREEELLSVYRDCFPQRRVIGCPAWHLLHGGGSFHCITQQVPV